MHMFSLPYAGSTMTVHAPEAGYRGTFRPKQDGDATATTDTILQEALDNPAAAKPLEQQVRPDQSVVIITSDLTRPCPSDVVLPPLLERLHRAGIPADQISIVIGLGLHRAMTPTELKQTVGCAVYQNYKVINHDLDDTVRVGTTRRGTPVEIFRAVAEADVRIGVGNVEFHYFAGFSGGAKAIIPGTASAATIKANHALMIQPGAAAAVLDGNPVREDLEEGADLVGIDYILNVIVNEHHQITAAAAGHAQFAHRQLCREIAARGTAALPAAVDVALVSAGGYPKDINLYQAQKALENTAGVVRPGGTLVLFAACPEGLGSDVFAEWITAGRTPEELVEAIQADFVLGGHKAAAIARCAQKMRIFLVTNSELADAQLTGLQLFTNPEKALAEAFRSPTPAAEPPTYAVFPLGSSLLGTAPANCSFA